MDEELIKAAVYVVDSFDQANTASAIERLGNRGQILKDAVNDLRELLNKDGQKTALTSKQVS